MVLSITFYLCLCFFTSELTYQKLYNKLLSDPTLGSGELCLGGLWRIALKKEENGWPCFGVRPELDATAKFPGDRGVSTAGGFPFWLSPPNLTPSSIKNNSTSGVATQDQLNATQDQLSAL